MKKIIKFLLQGILFTVPIAITIWVIVNIGDWVLKLVRFTGISIHPLVDPFLGLFGVFIILVLAGALGSSILFYPIFKKLEDLIEKTPFLKIVYTSVKDLLSAFVGQKKKFNKPVMVTVSETPHMEKLGFITQRSLTELGLPEDRVAVYFPLSYSLSGDLFIVSVKHVREVPVSSTEFMKFIISGGVTQIDANHTDREEEQ